MNGLPHQQWLAEAFDYLEAEGADRADLEAGDPQWEQWNTDSVSLRLVYGGDQAGELRRATRCYYDLRALLEDLMLPHGIRLRFLDIHGG